MSIDCDLSEVDLNVSSGNGASVTVVWAPGVRGTLELKAREVASKTLSASDDIVVDNVLFPPRFISKNLGGCSGTYTALFDEWQEPCSFMQVSWTVNGNFAGTGNPRSWVLVSANGESSVQESSALHQARKRDVPPLMVKYLLIKSADRVP